MLGSAPPKKRHPIVNLLTPVLIFVVLAGACFLFCEVIYLLNQAGVPQ